MGSPPSWGARHSTVRIGQDSRKKQACLNQRSHSLDRGLSDASRGQFCPRWKVARHALLYLPDARMTGPPGGYDSPEFDILIGGNPCTSHSTLGPPRSRPSDSQRFWGPTTICQMDGSDSIAPFRPEVQCGVSGVREPEESAEVHPAVGVEVLGDGVGQDGVDRRVSTKSRIAVIRRGSLTW